ncbi:MAG: putative metal-dependent hydrolase [Anaerolineae bacterium]|nr:putative metal-dependent hydrolase [Anaerolineae bacterium]
MALSSEERNELITRLDWLPPRLSALVRDLEEEDFHKPNPNGGWTIAQNLHHLADSHMNGFIRMKLMLTEDQPTLKPYDQDMWAETPEIHDAPVVASLEILTGLHRRWVVLLKNLEEEDWARQGHHPEVGRVTLDSLLKIYANHCEAHLKQIEEML